jgi:hypothetical protein
MVGRESISPKLLKLAYLRARRKFITAGGVCVQNFGLSTGRGSKELSG